MIQASFLQQLVDRHRVRCSQGEIVTYIPLLKEQDPGALGIAVLTADGCCWEAGASRTPFTLQSISKVASLILALSDRGEDEVFSKVGMEPTGDPFNSIYKMEVFSSRKPLNPMINAGAMVVCSLIKGNTVSECLERFLSLVRSMAGNDKIDSIEAVYQSEQAHAHRNRALAHLLKELNLIDDVDATLELYLRQCSVQVDCVDLANMGFCLAQYGSDRHGNLLFSESLARLVKTFMVTCGMYNASGEFAIKVGIPAKSGVSGGILASVPSRMGVGVFGPSLDEKGNSVGGCAVLRELSCEWGLSIF
ncbi:glutaminase A [Pasteuria penetrans]|uniref:glutaminase A n=1 Tax=Pasteuria penetrans TaxID=86005 RepID=UPI000F96316B|nr:glutaminase A [Pasteuria penetrans]